MRLCPAAVLAVLISTPAAAQTVPTLVAGGVAAADARNPAQALRDFQAAMAVDSTSYEANWRASIAAVDIGKQTPDSVPSPSRDSLYRLAERYATRAVAANPDGADGYFALANAIGRTSLTLGKKERVRRAGEIRTDALRAIELNPRQDGAFHVMGRWNAEIMRLSSFQRFFAKSFLGRGRLQPGLLAQRRVVHDEGHRDPPRVHLPSLRPGADLHGHQAVGRWPGSSSRSSRRCR